MEKNDISLEGSIQQQQTKKHSLNIWLAIMLIIF
jgi:hypothetical protein